jgi:hypothetical protein
MNSTVVETVDAHGISRGSIKFENGITYFYDENDVLVGVEKLPGQIVDPNGSNLSREIQTKVRNIRNIFRNRM